jgi:TRAP-type mannitol/chloroaromatic compound transport system permease large subunit|tara:strand:+ start:166 stop:387 length:222 start_codon:yes stop_codon:yes gene_type:complete
MNNPFTKHPHSVGETYLEHMKTALNTTIKIQLVVFIILIHAVFPFLFEQTGGDEIEKINNDLQNRRSNERELD